MEAKEKCPTKHKQRPISIRLTALSGSTGISMNDDYENQNHATFEVSIIMSRKQVEKYARKDLTLKDLYDIIEKRM